MVTLRNPFRKVPEISVASRGTSGRLFARIRCVSFSQSYVLTDAAPPCEEQQQLAGHAIKR